MVCLSARQTQILHGGVGMIAITLCQFFKAIKVLLFPLMPKVKS